VSSVDQVLQWDGFTRERFLAAWIVLFAMAGLYLLGFVRLEGVKPDEPIGLGRLLVGMAFVVSPSAWRRGCSAASWALWTLTFPWRAGRPWIVRKRAGVDERPVSRGARPRAARAKAGVRELHRLRLHQLPLDEGQHVHAAEIAAALQDFVLVELYTDGTDAVSEANQNLELSKFHHGGDSVLRHSGCGRKGGGDVRRLDQRREGIPGVFAGAGGRNCAGNWGVHGT